MLKVMSMCPRGCGIGFANREANAVQAASAGGASVAHAGSSLTCASYS
jgi:hypothetical protein